VPYFGQCLLRSADRITSNKAALASNPADLFERFFVAFDQESKGAVAQLWSRQAVHYPDEKLTAFVELESQIPRNPLSFLALFGNRATVCIRLLI
jgi:hypothetical protein